MGTTALVVRVGQPLPATLETWFEAESIDTAAFLSAANPRSRQKPNEENARRHSQLLRELQVLDVHWLPGSGRDPDGVWEAERSVLALRLTREQAMRLALQFEQNAYVEVLPRTPASLVFTAHWSSGRR